MSNLPDKLRPRLTQPAKALAVRVARVAARGAWRVMHPAVRGPYVESPKPTPMRRVTVQSSDGWRLPLCWLEARPGAPGEPVVLAHDVGLHADAMRYGAGSIAEHLLAAGFQVYFFSHRADRGALAPPGLSRMDLDAVVERDLAAALAAAAAHAGCERVHLVGHGLGGQLALMGGGLSLPHLATVCALGARARWTPARGTGRLRALSWVPSHWRLPTRRAAQLAATFVDEDTSRFAGAEVPGPRVRGLLRHASEDVVVGLLRHLEQWEQQGHLCTRDGAVDLVSAMGGATVPLLALSGACDDRCPGEQSYAAVRAWGAPAEWAEIPGADHHDLLHGRLATEQVFPRLCEWIIQRRKTSWLDASTTDAKVA